MTYKSNQILEGSQTRWVITTTPTVGRGLGDRGGGTCDLTTCRST